MGWNSAQFDRIRAGWSPAHTSDLPIRVERAAVILTTNLPLLGVHPGVPQRTPLKALLDRVTDSSLHPGDRDGIVSVRENLGRSAEKEGISGGVGFKFFR